MGKASDTTIPDFTSLEEEKAFWEARGPLAEGHKGTVNRPKPRQKRSSFLAVRLTGEELTRLRDMAAQLGLGPSTFARLLLMSVLEGPQTRELALGLFRALVKIGGDERTAPEDKAYGKVRDAAKRPPAGSMGASS
ncbi:MAG: hypothetical protein HYY01_02920 [Chloroflexi bacterium]|nr:hypothetical protein [Chloroflexota bacterium]